MGPRGASTLCRLDAAQSLFQSHKDKYEKLRADVAIKLKFLEENKVGLGRGRGAQSGGLPCTGCVPWLCCLAAACPRPVFGWAAPAGKGRGAPVSAHLSLWLLPHGLLTAFSFWGLSAAALTSRSCTRWGPCPCCLPLLLVRAHGGLTPPALPRSR